MDKPQPVSVDELDDTVLPTWSPEAEFAFRAKVLNQFIQYQLERVSGETQLAWLNFQREVSEFLESADPSDLSLVWPQPPSE